MSSKWRFAGILVLICCEASAGEWRTETVADLDVHLYEPALLRALLIALHGCTQSHDALRDRGNFEGPADLHQASIARPQVLDGGVFADCWDSYVTDTSLDNRHNRYPIALVDALGSQHAIDPDRVYLIGLSSGAGEAFVIG